MLSAISETMRNLFGPQAINGALASTVDETCEARAIISEATAQIRQWLAERQSLERELEVAKERQQSIRAQLDLVAPAAERAAKAREADAADRKKRMEAGNPCADTKLTDAVETAERELREAERNATAAEAALPALEELTREAQAALAQNIDAVDLAIWRRRLAELSLQLPEVRSAAAIVAEFATRVATLKDIGIRHRLYNTPRGSVPAEWSEVCTIEPPTVEPWSNGILAEIDYLRRLREDPEATFD